ncbi:MAG: hypothetical protein QOJ33_416 [Chloroflexota bacterium]|jgi:hypothetical protein|nr:hypothetical protein [Mycobacterium sp.]MEA2667482.1 hypothetical protein [Chloroflexota bacterium]
MPGGLPPTELGARNCPIGGAGHRTAARGLGSPARGGAFYDGSGGNRTYPVQLHGLPSPRGP